jgi:Zn-dependent oligopeptidase
MEHWCWRPEVLARFARHHETGEPIPTELVEQLVAARDLNIGVQTLRQVQFGVLDMGFHGPRRPEDGERPDGSRDLDAILRRAEAVALFEHVDGTFMPASFGHLLGGYDAGYYGYLWSKVYGDDMFSRFAADGVTNPTVGRSYRAEILERGGSRPAMEMLEDFLGRQPNNEAFLAELGIA